MVHRDLPGPRQASLRRLDASTAARPASGLTALARSPNVRLVEIEHGNARGKPYRVVFNGSLDEHWYNDASMDKLSKIGHDDTFRAPAAASKAAADEPKELAPIASLGGKAGPLRRPSQKPADASRPPPQ